MTIPTSEIYWGSLRNAAENGDLSDVFSLASAYEEGITDSDGRAVVPKSIRKAYYWYRRGAENGDACCQLQLGNYFSEGIGVKLDQASALYWYKKAFKNNYLSAATNIAIEYKDLGNIRRSMFWHKRAAELGDGDAFFDLGVIYYTGNGVRKNYSLAVQCFRSAIKSSRITEFSREEAMCYLSQAYLDGYGVKRSLKKAKQWLCKANKDNDHPLAVTIQKRLN